MAEAKVLTAKQQRKTLSNVKKKKKAPLRNVYGHPRKENWPVLDSENECFILNHMRKLLCEKASKKISKPKDMAVGNLIMSSSKESEPSHQIETISSQLVLGLSKVIVEIEKGNLKCLLMASDVDPPSLGYLVGNLAAAHNVPFVAVSNLRNCLEELLGFKSCCVGFTVSSKHFDLICDRVKSIINSMEEEKAQETSSHIEDAKQNNSTSTSVKMVKKISDLHLYRTDRSKRAFVPESGTTQNNLESSFLAFSKDVADNTDYQESGPIKSTHRSGIAHKLSSGSQKSLGKPRYFDKIQLLPLQVKRFQENPNKQKWKKSKNRSVENDQQLI